jgi:hypothetical protein
MISLCVIPALDPNMSLADKIKSSITCLILDGCYIIPILL